MNGRVAKHIRRVARTMCNPRLGIEVSREGTWRWPNQSYRGAIRLLKKWRARGMAGLLSR